MSKTLHLTLKKKWFDMIASGEKKEEYREIKPYWVNRMFQQKIYQSKIEDLCWIIQGKNNELEPNKYIKTECLEYINYTNIQFRNGYSKDAPTITLECKGIEIREGKEEWGAVPGEKYFLIKLGNETP